MNTLRQKFNKNLNRFRLVAQRCVQLSFCAEGREGATGFFFNIHIKIGANGAALFPSAFNKLRYEVRYLLNLYKHTASLFLI